MAKNYLYIYMIVLLFLIQNKPEAVKLLSHKYLPEYNPYSFESPHLLLKLFYTLTKDQFNAFYYYIFKIHKMSIDTQKKHDILVYSPSGGYGITGLSNTRPDHPG